MTDFLHRLADRVTAAAPAVRPRLPALFEPTSAGPAGDRADMAPGPPPESSRLNGGARMRAASPDGPVAPDASAAIPDLAPTPRSAARPGAPAAPRDEQADADVPEGDRPVLTGSSPAARPEEEGVCPSPVQRPDGPPPRPSAFVQPDRAPDDQPQPVFRATAQRTPADHGTEPPALDQIASRPGDAPPLPAGAGHPPVTAPDDRPGLDRTGQTRPVPRPTAQRTSAEQRTDSPALDQIAARRAIPVSAAEPASFPDRPGSVGRRPAGPPAGFASAISVTIGRVEVRAAAAPPAARPATQRPVSTALDDYLRQRARGNTP